jgi:hypothetical protein
MTAFRSGDATVADLAPAAKRHVQRSFNAFPNASNSEFRRHGLSALAYRTGRISVAICTNTVGLYPPQR